MKVLLDIELFEDQIMNSHLLNIAIDCKHWLQNKLDEYDSLKGLDEVAYINLKPGNISLGYFGSHIGPETFLNKLAKEFAETELDKILSRYIPIGLN